MACIDVCRKYAAKFVPGVSRYISGQKYCRSCESWIWWEGNNCPCCSHILRTTPKIAIHRRPDNTQRTVQCNQCGKWIETLSAARKYCDDDCLKESLRTRPRRDHVRAKARARYKMRQRAIKSERIRKERQGLWPAFSTRFKNTL